MARRIKFASPEHQSREINAAHFHYDGHVTYIYGNGRSVMIVVKGKRPFIEVREPGDTGMGGGPFSYEGHFLPEELAP